MAEFLGTNVGETIFASPGDDYIIGLGGNDALRGLAGNDVYGFYGVFGSDFVSDSAGRDLVRIGADYAEQDFRPLRTGNDLTITQINGTQSVSIEGFFAVPPGVGDTIENIVFDRTGVIWELTSGQVVVRPGYFDYDGYMSANSDVRAAGSDPYPQYVHYSTIGWREARDPSARFDTTLYLQQNPDVAAAGINPLQHFLTAGQSEGRVAQTAVGTMIRDGFDAEYYLLTNSDVGMARLDAASHYATNGWREGRDPSFLFDTSYYLEGYSDVAAAGINPLAHYNAAGWREGRDPSARFDTSAYLSANPDVAAALVNPLQHYLQFGIYEGRSLGDIGIA